MDGTETKCVCAHAPLHTRGTGVSYACACTSVRQCVAVGALTHRLPRLWSSLSSQSVWSRLRRL